MKYFRQKVIVTFISILFFSLFSLNSQETDSEWYIARIKSGTSINQKEMYGPYDSLEKTIATWIYSEVKEASKYCITKNYSFVTSKPSTYYRKQYQDIQNEFLKDAEKAAENFGVDTENLVGKKKKTVKKTKSTEEETNETSEDNSENTTDENNLVVDNENAASQFEKNQNEIDTSSNTNNDTNEISNTPTNISEQNTEVKSVDTEDKEYKAASATYVPKTKKEEIKAEDKVETNAVTEKEVNKTETKTEEIKPYTFEMDKNATVTRYKKEYLQDFIPEDKQVPSDELVSVNRKIENPDKKDNYGRTALMIAAKSGNDWQITNLLDSDANVNLQDNDGWTALMYAVRYQESTSIIKSLLNAGADVKITNNYDSNALTYAACYNNNPEILKLILDKYSISEKDVIKAFSMMLSSKQTSELIEQAKINVFIERSIPLNSLYNGKTPLMYGAQFANYTSIIKMLLDNGAITGVRSSEGKTAFDYAIENKSLEHDDIYWSLNKN